MPCNYSFYYVNSCQKSIWANITIRLKETHKSTRSTSETMPLDTSNNDSDGENQSQEGFDQATDRAPVISRTPAVSQSIPTRSSARIATLHRNMSTPTEDPSSSSTLPARKIYPGVEHSVFERAFAAIKESEEITRSLSGRIRERLQIIQQWEAILKRREEDEEEEQRKKRRRRESSERLYSMSRAQWKRICLIWLSEALNFSCLENPPASFRICNT